MGSAEKVPAVGTLYHSYELLSLLSVLYAKALGYEYHAERKKMWSQNLESTIEDLEVCCTLWQINNAELEYGLPVKIPEDVALRAARLKKHLVSVDQCVHPWAILRRLPKSMMKCEERFTASLQGLSDTMAQDKSELSALAETATKRIAGLQKLYEHFAGESRTLLL